MLGAAFQVYFRSAVSGIPLLSQHEVFTVAGVYQRVIPPGATFLQFQACGATGGGGGGRHPVSGGGGAGGGAGASLLSNAIPVTPGWIIDITIGAGGTQGAAAGGNAGNGAATSVTVNGTTYTALGGFGGLGGSPGVGGTGGEGGRTYGGGQSGIGGTPGAGVGGNATTTMVAGYLESGGGGGGGGPNNNGSTPGGKGGNAALIAFGGVVCPGLDPATLGPGFQGGGGPGGPGSVFSWGPPAPTTLAGVGGGGISHGAPGPDGSAAFEITF